jgi:putative Ca2+/H+ antiporter (TMEM165/GDT1 family)
MDLKTFFVTFGLVFAAELGDKTQLTTMLLAAKSDLPAVVFAGAALALVASALLGTLFGEAVTHVIPERYIHLGAGVAFVCLGVLLISGKM